MCRLWTNPPAHEALWTDRTGSLVPRMCLCVFARLQLAPDRGAATPAHTAVPRAPATRAPSLGHPSCPIPWGTDGTAEPRSERWRVPHMPGHPSCPDTWGRTSRNPGLARNRSGVAAASRRPTTPCPPAGARGQHSRRHGDAPAPATLSHQLGHVVSAGDDTTAPRASDTAPRAGARCKRPGRHRNTRPQRRPPTPPHRLGHVVSARDETWTCAAAAIRTARPTPMTARTPRGRPPPR